MALFDFLGMVFRFIHAFDNFMFFAYKPEHLLADVNHIITMQLHSVDLFLVDVGVVGTAEIPQEEFAIAVLIGFDFDDGVLLAGKVIQNTDVIIVRATAEANNRLIDLESNGGATIRVLHQVSHDLLLLRFNRLQCNTFVCNSYTFQDLKYRGDQIAS